MAKLLLDLAEVAGLLEQVDGQGMPGGVNRKLCRQAGPLYGRLPDPLQALCGQRSPSGDLLCVAFVD